MQLILRGPLTLTEEDPHLYFQLAFQDQDGGSVNIYCNDREQWWRLRQVKKHYDYRYWTRTVRDGASYAEIVGEPAKADRLAKEFYELDQRRDSGESDSQPARSEGDGATAERTDQSSKEFIPF